MMVLKMMNKILHSLADCISTYIRFIELIIKMILGNVASVEARGLTIRQVLTQDIVVMTDTVVQYISSIKETYPAIYTIMYIIICTIRIINEALSFD